MQSLLETYVPKILALPDTERFTKTDLLTPDFLLEQEGNVSIYYAPYDYINQNARLAIIGITPGWTQMEISYRTARKALQSGIPMEEVCKKAKQMASFAGSMRTNLIQMLDELEVCKALGIDSCKTLFGDAYEMLHTTSILRYPVFVKGENYTGHTPKVSRSRLLTKYVTNGFQKEIQELNQPLIIPLGKTVSDVLESLIEQKQLHRKQCLLGFPHPSGANGHQKKQFAAMKEQLKHVVKEWGGHQMFQRKES